MPKWLNCGIVPGMNNFKEGGFKKQGGKFGGRPQFGGNRPKGGSHGGGKFAGQGRSDRPSELFPTTCSECGKSCEVPFRPSSDKPVYCSNCFGKRSDDSRNDRGGQGRNDRSDYSKPSRDERPARHDRPQVQADNGLGDIKRQLATIESRLNRILDLINPAVPAVKVAPVSVVKENIKETVKNTEKQVIDKAIKTTSPKKVVKKVTAKKVAKKAAKKATKKAAK